MDVLPQPDSPTSPQRLSAAQLKADRLHRVNRPLPRQIGQGEVNDLEDGFGVGLVTRQLNVRFSDW